MRRISRHLARRRGALIVLALVAAAVVPVAALGAQRPAGAAPGWSQLVRSVVWSHDAPTTPLAANPSPAVGIATSPTGAGYYVVRANGVVDAVGAPNYGSLAPGSLPVGVSVTGIAVDPRTGGYWIVASNGWVRAFHAPFLGQPRIHPGGWGQYPAAVGIASSPTGAGYYVVRANGAVGAFGVPAEGSLAGRLVYGATAPNVAVAIAVDPRTGGYWIATSNGRVVNFHAPAVAAAPSGRDGAAMVAIAAESDGSGYLALFANGRVVAETTQGTRALAGPAALPAGVSATGLTLNPASTGYYVSLDATSVGGYRNPLRALSSLVPQEIDQGVDYCAAGPIYALGDGVVANLYFAGWPSGVFISYRLSSGPAAGRYVYVAENVTPRVSIGERVTARTVLGIVHDAKTCFETGWADPPGPLERAAGHALYTGRNSTAYGLNFSDLLGALGARPGLPQSGGSPGSLPAGWPTWSTTSAPRATN